MQDTNNRMYDRSSLVYLVATLALALLALSMTWPGLRDDVFDRDEGAYATMALAWSQGEIPYLDVFDHRAPLMVVLYRLAFLVEPSLLTVRLLFLAMCVGTGLLCMALLRSLLPGRPLVAPILAGLLATYYLCAAHGKGGIASAEIPTALLITAGVAVVGRLKRRLTEPQSLACGICLGLAIVCKPTACFEALFVLAWLIWRRRAEDRHLRLAVQAVVAYLVGVLLPITVVMLYAHWHGAMGAMYEALVVYQLDLTSRGALSVAERMEALKGQIAGPFLPSWAALAALAMLTTFEGRPKYATFLLGWSITAFIAMLVAGRIYVNFSLQLAPPLAVITGLVVGRAGLLFGRRATMGAVVAVVLLLTPSLKDTIHRIGHWSAYSSWQAQVGRQLNEQLPRDASVLVWGAEPSVYFYARRPIASRYIDKHPLLGHGEFSEKARARFKAEMIRQLPCAVVIVRGDQIPEEPLSSVETWASSRRIYFGHALDNYCAFFLRGCILLVSRDLLSA